MYHRTNQIRSMFPNLSKPQAAVLAAFSFGIAKDEFRPLNAVALTFLGIPDTVEARLRRFISNPRIDMAESCERFARSVIRAPPRKKPVILLVDETSLKDRLKAIECLGMHCMMRVSKIVRALMDDETVFQFKSLTVESGESWRAKAKAFKNAGWVGRWAERLPRSRT